MPGLQDDLCKVLNYYADEDETVIAAITQENGGIKKPRIKTRDLKRAGRDSNPRPLP